MKITRADIAQDISKATGIPAYKVGPLLESYFNAIKEALAQGKDIELRGFGAFRRRLRKGHMALNPRTGCRIPIPAHWVVKFRPAEKLMQP